MFLPLHDQNPIRHIEFPFVNYGLIALTSLMFLIQTGMGGADTILMHIRFGMIPQEVRDVVANPASGLPDTLTLISYAFFHADWLHLLSNMLFLWIFGDNIEDAFGHVRYLVFYLLAAVLAALAHTLFFWDSFIPLIGASGAVAGVMGAYVLLYPHARVFVLARIIVPIPLPLPAFWMLGVWMATQIFYAIALPDDPVAWWAHIGGAIAGAGLALVFKRKEVEIFGGR
jgi:membrane associated rhomboid family serine protease